jgi:hypothetical protein
MSDAVFLLVRLPVAVVALFLGDALAWMAETVQRFGLAVLRGWRV